MVARKKPTPPVEKAEHDFRPVSLSAAMSKKPIFQIARFWIVGDTPLIVHAWSEKARRHLVGSVTPESVSLRLE